jgi:CheY-like chemotaxis protein
MVSVGAEESAREWVISVSDNGPGIDAHQRARIFEPFARLAEGAGLGMGLAICKRIVEAHHGKLWCESSDWGGAKFVFTIPKPQDQHGTIDAAASAGAAPDPDPQTPGDLATILVVDDNEAAIELARIMLVEQSKLECRLMSARSGGEALELLQRSAQNGAPVDLMLLDINMPRMDGFEVLRELAAIANLAAPPVVMCSTSSYDKDKERAKSLGAYGYLEKPPQLHQLKPIFDALPGLRMETRERGRALLRVH